VEHWVDAGQRANNIHIVRYEDLAQRYDDTITRLGRRLGMQPCRIVPPPRNVNVVQAGTLAWAPGPGSDNRDAVAELALARFPALMDRLGYGAASVSASAG
jgi:hypothetical protein